MRTKILITLIACSFACSVYGVTPTNKNVHFIEPMGWMYGFPQLWVEWDGYNPNKDFVDSDEDDKLPSNYSLSDFETMLNGKPGVIIFNAMHGIDTGNSIIFRSYKTEDTRNLIYNNNTDMHEKLDVTTTSGERYLLLLKASWITTKFSNGNTIVITSVCNGVNLVTNCFSSATSGVGIAGTTDSGNLQTFLSLVLVDMWTSSSFYLIAEPRRKPLEVSRPI